MQGYDREDAKRFILSKLDTKPFRGFKHPLADVIDDFITYDLHYMRLSGVLDEDGQQGENSYDDDEAFEYIYDAWLGDNPDDEDEDMLVAALLDRYMEFQYAYLCSKGLAEL